MKTNPLTDVLLSSAFKTMVAAPGLEDRMRWWLVWPHSAETWFQFEYAYHLNEVFRGEHWVHCEIRSADRTRADLAIFSSLPSEESPEKWAPVAKIELKVSGNWYITQTGVEGDVNKIDKDAVPSMAICLWTLVKPSPEAPKGRYSVIERQMSNGTGTTDAGEIDGIMRKCGMKPLDEREIHVIAVISVS